MRKEEQPHEKFLRQYEEDSDMFEEMYPWIKELRQLKESRKP